MAHVQRSPIHRRRTSVVVGSSSPIASTVPTLPVLTLNASPYRQLDFGSSDSLSSHTHAIDAGSGGHKARARFHRTRANPIASASSHSPPPRRQRTTASTLVRTLTNQLRASDNGPRRTHGRGRFRFSPTTTSRRTALQRGLGEDNVLRGFGPGSIPPPNSTVTPPRRRPRNGPSLISSFDSLQARRVRRQQQLASRRISPSSIRLRPLPVVRPKISNPLLEPLEPIVGSSPFPLPVASSLMKSADHALLSPTKPAALTSPQASRHRRRPPNKETRRRGHGPHARRRGSQRPGRDDVPTIGIATSVPFHDRFEPTYPRPRMTLTDLSLDTLSVILSFLRTWREIFRVMSTCSLIRNFFVNLERHHLDVTRDLPTFILRDRSSSTSTASPRSTIMIPSREVRYISDAVLTISSASDITKLRTLFRRVPNVIRLELKMGGLSRLHPLHRVEGLLEALGELKEQLQVLRLTNSLLMMSDSLGALRRKKIKKTVEDGNEEEEEEEGEGEVDDDDDTEEEELAEQNRRNADLLLVLRSLPVLEELIMGRDMESRVPKPVPWKLVPEELASSSSSSSVPVLSFRNLRFIHLGGRFVFEPSSFVDLLATFPRLRGIVLGASVPKLFSQPFPEDLVQPHDRLKTLWVKMPGQIGATGFASILKMFPTVKALALPDARIEWPTSLLGYNFRSVFVRRLQVWNNRLGLDGFLCIVRSFPNLHVLDVHHNNISIADDVAVARVRSLGEANLPFAITALVIGRNEVSFDGLSALIAILPGLIRLDCEDCDVFGGSLMVDHRRARKSKLQELRLGPSEGLWNQCILGATTMATLFTRLKSLRLLYIRGYAHFGWESLTSRALARRLRAGRSSLRSLEFSISMTWELFVTVLNSLPQLSSCWVSRGCVVRYTSGVENPAVLLRHHRALRELVLSHNMIRAQSVWDILMACDGLKRLDVDGCGIVEKELLCASKPKQSSNTTTAQCTNCSLSHLDIGENQSLRFQGFRLILQTCPSLRRVIASDCGIQIPPRMPHLVRHFGIRTLDLSSNWHLYRVGIIESLCAFYFPNLRRCNVSNCGWTHDEFFRPDLDGVAKSSQTEWICRDL